MSGEPTTIAVAATDANDAVAMSMLELGDSAQQRAQSPFGSSRLIVPYIGSAATTPRTYGGRTLSSQRVGTATGSRASHDGALLAAVRRQIEASEEKTSADISRIQHQGDHLRDAAFARLEDKMHVAEANQTKFDRRLAEITGNIKGLSDEMQAQIRRVDFTDERFAQIRHRIEEDFRQKVGDLEQSIEKIASSTRVKTAAFDDDTKRVRQRLQRLEEDVAQRCEHQEETQSFLVDVHNRLEAVEDRHLEQFAIGVSPAVGKTSSPILSSSIVLEPFDHRLDDISTKVNDMFQELRDLHTQFTAQEEQVRCLRTQHELRDEHVRKLSETVERRDLDGKVDQIKRHVVDEGRQRLEHQERIEIHSQRVAYLEQAHEELRGKHEQLCRSSSSTASANAEYMQTSPLEALANLRTELRQEFAHTVSGIQQELSRLTELSADGRETIDRVVMNPARLALSLKDEHLGFPQQDVCSLCDSSKADRQKLESIIGDLGCLREEIRETMSASPSNVVSDDTVESSLRDQINHLSTSWQVQEARVTDLIGAVTTCQVDLKEVKENNGSWVHELRQVRDHIAGLDPLVCGEVTRSLPQQNLDVEATVTPTADQRVVLRQEDLQPFRDQLSSLDDLVQACDAAIGGVVRDVQSLHEDVERFSFDRAGGVVTPKQLQDAIDSMSEFSTQCCSQTLTHKHLEDALLPLRATFSETVTHKHLNDALAPLRAGVTQQQLQEALELSRETQVPDVSLASQQQELKEALREVITKQELDNFAESLRSETVTQVAVAQQQHHDAALRLTDAVTQQQLEGALASLRHDSVTSQQLKDVSDSVASCVSQQQLSEAIESFQEVAESVRNSVLQHLQEAAETLRKECVNHKHLEDALEPIKEVVTRQHLEEVVLSLGKQSTELAGAMSQPNNNGIVAEDMQRELAAVRLDIARFAHVDVEQFSSLMLSVREEKIVENDAHRTVVARVNELCEQLSTVETTITAVAGRTSSEPELIQRFEGFVDQVEHRFDDFSKHRLLRVENDVSLVQTRLDDIVAKHGTAACRDGGNGEMSTDHLASLAQTVHANAEAERSAHQRLLVRINDLCEQMASIENTVILDSGTNQDGVDPEPSSAKGQIELPLKKEESLSDLEEQW